MPFVLSSYYKVIMILQIEHFFLPKESLMQREVEKVHSIMINFVWLIAENFFVWLTTFDIFHSAPYWSYDPSHVQAFWGILLIEIATFLNVVTSQLIKICHSNLSRKPIREHKKFIVKRLFLIKVSPSIFLKTFPLLSARLASF